MKKWRDSFLLVTKEGVLEKIIFGKIYIIYSKPNALLNLFGKLYYIINRLPQESNTMKKSGNLT